MHIAQKKTHVENLFVISEFLPKKNPQMSRFNIFMLIVVSRLNINNDFDIANLSTRLFKLGVNYYM